MNIVEWFNPNDINHLRAYNHLLNKGVWPDGFIPCDVEFRAGSMTEGVTCKIAELYVDRRIAEDDYRNEQKARTDAWKAEQKAKLLSKPKADEVITLMSKGWKLYRAYLRNSSDHIFIQGENTTRDLNANTLTSLVKKGLVKTVPNPYPMTKATEYILA